MASHDWEARHQQDPSTSSRFRRIYDRRTETQQGSRQSSTGGGDRATRPASRALQRDGDAPSDASGVADL
jgi:hypothetical protein